MKTILKTLAVLLLTTLAITSCNDDENNSSKDSKEYALTAKFYITAVDSTFENLVPSLLDSAMSSMGMSKDNSYIYITARDSADAAPQIKALAEKMEAVLYDAPYQLAGSVDIYAIEKQQLGLDGKDRQWKRWHTTSLGSSENSASPVNAYWESTYKCYVYGMEIYSSRSWSVPVSEYTGHNTSEYIFQYYIPSDINSGSGGNYIYLKLTAASFYNETYVVFNSVTDVVMLNTGRDKNHPDHVDIVKDDVTRHYYPVQPNSGSDDMIADLNFNAGGPYLWMYYTTDARGGYVLANRTADLKYWTKIIEKSDVVKETSDLKYMHVYKQNADGQWEDKGIANMNEGVSGSPLYFQMAFLQDQ